MTQIRGKAAVVSGGGSGLGRGIALALAAQGAKIVVGDIMPENAQAVADEIIARGGQAIAVDCDVSDRESVRTLKRKANEAFGAILLVIPNAGATSFRKLHTLSDNDIDWIIEVNLMGVLNFVQAFLPDMLAAGDGHFVASASVAGLIPTLITDHVAYSAAKAGVIGAMMNLRRELEGTGVQSTTFCVASVDGNMRANNSKYRPVRFGGPYEEAITTPASFKRGTPKSPEEVAGMVLAAIRNNRPMLVSDSNYRRPFMEQYVEAVVQAFDDVDEFYRQRA